jgi:hypothetical protein
MKSTCQQELNFFWDQKLALVLVLEVETADDDRDDDMNIWSFDMIVHVK